MIADILVCLEGSPSGVRASEVAIDVARRLEAALVGLAIVDEPDIHAREATGIGGSSYKQQRDEVLLEDAQAQAKALLEAFTESCRAAGVPSSALERRGRPDTTILKEIQGHDLTVLGRHANFRFETTDDDRQTRDTILRKAGTPVLVVPEGSIAAGPGVLVAYDGSMASRRALVSFANSGLGDDCPVHVAAVDDDGATAWEIASKGCLLLREHEIRAQPHNLVSTLSIAEALLERRAKVDAGLIVLGAYTRSRLSRMIWGSVTDEMLAKTVVPLYLHY
jgi:nucleotide-binding universal stress UspA family protein